MQHKVKTSTNQNKDDAKIALLYCVECGYTHPMNAGLEEGDICPDCGQGILVKI